MPVHTHIHIYKYIYINCIEVKKAMSSSLKTNVYFIKKQCLINY